MSNPPGPPRSPRGVAPGPRRVPRPGGWRRKVAGVDVRRPVDGRIAARETSTSSRRTTRRRCSRRARGPRRRASRPRASWRTRARTSATCARVDLDRRRSLARSTRDGSSTTQLEAQRRCALVGQPELAGRATRYNFMLALRAVGHFYDRVLTNVPVRRLGFAHGAPTSRGRRALRQNEQGLRHGFMAPLDSAWTWCHGESRSGESRRGRAGTAGRSTYRMHFKSINATTRAYTGPQHPCVGPHRRPRPTDGRRIGDRRAVRGLETPPRRPLLRRGCSTPRGSLRHARAFEARACARGWRAARRARKAPQPDARVEHNRRRRRRRRPRALETPETEPAAADTCARLATRHDDVTAEDVDTESMED